MKVIFLVLCCLLLIEERAAECPEGFTLINSNCYWFRKDPEDKANWFKADMLCNRRGARLLSFDSLEEMNTLSDYIIAEGCNTNSIECTYWASANCLAQQDKFFWQSTHKRVKKQFFNKGEPNNLSGDEYCTDFRHDQESKYGLGDVPCTWRTPNFICKAPLKSAECVGMV
ncbi:C-type lectin 37Db-like [Scaptodrosophila lebanonensis]|uniref:C-type lectin 37Db-like n=1 Tax=Drosophila lebanonensis TaxID=7225 RepID=A0A6J2TI56_DROLE|nr:C-type lectin 37Db-like [Scaptodrosophila lebanonensis]